MLIVVVLCTAIIAVSDNVVKLSKSMLVFNAVTMLTILGTVTRTFTGESRTGRCRIASQTSLTQLLLPAMM